MHSNCLKRNREIYFKLFVEVESHQEARQLPEVVTVCLVVYIILLSGSLLLSVLSILVSV